MDEEERQHTFTPHFYTSSFQVNHHKDHNESNNSRSKIDKSQEKVIPPLPETSHHQIRRLVCDQLLLLFRCAYVFSHIQRELHTNKQ
jgi:hypothetical protein